jgi:ATP/maltotriose-dependent transcriptional regulator MalT
LPRVARESSPRIAETACARPRVLERLERALGFRATFLVAGPGYGKSTAIRQLLPMHPALRAVRASRLEATPERLVQTILAIFGIARAESKTRRAFELMGPRESAYRLLTDLPTGAVIAIDDFHEYSDSPECLDLIRGMIEFGPDHLRFLISSRTLPPYPLAEWVARGIASVPLEAGELSFNLAEIDAVLERSENRILAARRVLDATVGWPLAVALACAGKIPLTAGENAIGNLVHDYLEREILRELSVEERDVLRIASLQPSISLEVMDNANGMRAGASVESLAAKLPQLVVVRDGCLQVHDLLRSCLTRQDDRNLSLRVGEAHEAAGAIKPALFLFLASRNHIRIMDFLVTHGAELVERHDSAIEDAICSYADSRLRKHPVVLALVALRDTRRGDLDRAQSLFEGALAKVDDPGLKAAIAQSLGALLNNRGRPGAVEVLRDLRHADLPPRTHAEVLGVLAAAHMIAGQISSASDIAMEAVKEAEQTTDDQLLAGTLQRAAVVAFHSADPGLAEESARRAIALATSIGDDLIRSRALVVLYATLHAYHDDYRAALMHARASVEAGKSAGDTRGVVFGLTAEYEILVECGQLDMADRIGTEIEAAALPLGYQDTPLLHFARAIRAVIGCDFKTAHRTLSALPDHRCTPAQRVLRDGYLTLFSIPISPEDAESRLDLLIQDIRGVERQPLSLIDARDVSLARVMASLASGLLGRNSAAVRILPRRRPVLNAASVGRLIDCVGNVVRMRLYVTDRPDEASAYEPIVGVLEGWRLCLTALVSAVRSSRGASSCPLTPMQLTVLRELAKGYRSREVAQKLGISVNTHANHVREIIKRLKCSGREEALRAARSLGYV